MLLRFLAPLAALAVLAPAQEIRVTSGIADFQVVQRNTGFSGDLKFGGTIAGSKGSGRRVEARLLKGDTPLAGFDWVAIGKAQRQNWAGELKNVPVGGPYTLEVRLQGAAAVYPVENILVGDLWILGGQSNMEGNGNLVDVQQSIPQVHSFDMTDKWLIAQEPLHTARSAKDPVHWAKNEQSQPQRLTGQALEDYQAQRKKGAGLGLPFAAEMYRRTGVPIGLIPCAHGGTSMDQWSPALKDKGGDSLYGSMLRRFHAAGGSVKGMLWYQGESDANPQAAPEFRSKFEDFVKAVRADFNQADLPFYYVQIGRHVSSENAVPWRRVQLAQLEAESEIPHAGMVASIDCTLDDPIHISTEGLKRLAHRLANRVSHDLFPTVDGFADLKSGPRPVSAKYEESVVKVTFTGVNSKLESDGRLAGFSIHDEKGALLPLVFRAAIDPANASTVLLYVPSRPPAKAAVWYGFGKDPYCNLHDTADMAAPVFGPLPIQ